MTNKFKQLQLEKLDQHLAEIRICSRPSDGWIRAIRKSLGMSVSQLAKRLSITQQAVSQLELNEVNETVSLKTLRRAAEVLDCRLVYAFIPNEQSLQSVIEKQALKKARELVSAVNHTMELEAQGVGNLEEKIKASAKELAKNPNSKLWEGYDK
jgi:predicted DNA-binding mobile mystery protein A